MKRYQREVTAMHKKRKSDEEIEIVAYILKHSHIDEECVDDVSSKIDFIKENLSKRQYALKYCGAKENQNDIFVHNEKARLETILHSLRARIIKSTSKGEFFN